MSTSIHASRIASSSSNSRHWRGAAPVFAALLAALAAGAARADDPTIDNTEFVSTRTRTELKAEVREARVAHALMAAGEQGMGEPASSVSLVSRAAVKAEVLAARAHGDLLHAGEVDVSMPQPSRGVAQVGITVAARR
jgi:hypothetical protein